MFFLFFFTVLIFFFSWKITEWLLWVFCLFFYQTQSSLVLFQQTFLLVIAVKAQVLLTNNVSHDHETTTLYVILLFSPMLLLEWENEVTKFRVCWVLLCPICPRLPEKREWHIFNVCEQGFKFLLNLKQKHTW